NYNQHIPVQLSYSDERGQYMCQNSLGLGPLDGRPLEEGPTYAAVITTGLRDIRGDGPIQDLDFSRIIAADSTLPQHVLDVTEPLRAWISDQAMDATTIAAAAVFTTSTASAIAADLRQAVHDLPPPTFDSNAFDCEVTPNPGFSCHQALGR